MSVADSYLNGNKGNLQKLGKALCRWDGTPPTPGAQTLGNDWKPLNVGGGGKIASQRKRDELLAEARLELERVRNKYYPDLR